MVEMIEEVRGVASVSGIPEEPAALARNQIVEVPPAGESHQPTGDDPGHDGSTRRSRR
jgi:hypothetical protein